MSEDERDQQLANLNSQFVASVCFLTFEHARERLFGKSHLSISESLPFTSTSFHNCDGPLDSKSSVTSTGDNRGGAVMIDLSALPHLKSTMAGPTLTTTSTISTSGNLHSVSPGSNPNTLACAYTVVTNMPCHGLLPTLSNSTTSRVGPHRVSSTPTTGEQNNGVKRTSPQLPRPRLALVCSPNTTSIVAL